MFWWWSHLTTKSVDSEHPERISFQFSQWLVVKWPLQFKLGTSKVIWYFCVAFAKYQNRIIQKNQEQKSTECVYAITAQAQTNLLRRTLRNDERTSLLFDEFIVSHSTMTSALVYSITDVITATTDWVFENERINHASVCVCVCAVLPS